MVTTSEHIFISKSRQSLSLKNNRLIFLIQGLRLKQAFLFNITRPFKHTHHDHTHNEQSANGIHPAKSY